MKAFTGCKNPDDMLAIFKRIVKVNKGDHEVIHEEMDK